VTGWATGAAARRVHAELDLPPVDLTDLDCFADGFPHDVFTVLRRRAPVWWHEPTDHTPDGIGFWVVSSHAACLAAVANPQTFSSERAPGACGGGTLIEDLPHGLAAGVLLNMMDDPRHQRLRRLVTPALVPRALAAMEPDLRDRTAAILDPLADAGGCDFVDQVAAELPMQATASLLGVPVEDARQLMAWSNATLDHDHRDLGQEDAAAQAAAAALADYGRQLLRSKRASDADDMLAMLCRGTVEGPDGTPGPPSELEQLLFFSLMVTAGSETTRNAIALGLAALMEHPEEIDWLRADPTRWDRAVEEILRWTSPTTYNRRTATIDTELHGVPIRQGDKVTLWWASANRDEDVFDEPFRFDIRRDPNPHLAFGARSHFCLGANLARMEIRIVLGALTDRFEAFELAGPIERFRTNKHAGVRRMPISFRPRARSGRR